MSKHVKPVPDGYHTVTPYLCLRNAGAAIEFYQKAFGAKEKLRMPGPGGKIMHAELQIGDSTIMLSDEFPEMSVQSPAALGGTPVSLLLYLENVDRVFGQAIVAGAREIRPLKDQFYGDRSGTLEDPYGHKWTLSTHIEDVSPEEMQRRMMAATPA
jgi:PhnB protein